MILTMDLDLFFFNNPVNIFLSKVDMAWLGPIPTSEGVAAESTTLCISKQNVTKLGLTPMRKCLSKALLMYDYYIDFE